MDALPSYADPPFAVPPDVVIDLPPPISVNKLRTIDWVGQKRAKNWRKVANNYLLMVKQRPTRVSRFEILIVLDEATVKCDADNSAKMIIDYLRLVEIITNDAPKNMRRVVIEWGKAPLGCRVTIKPLPLNMRDVLRTAEAAAQ